MKLAVAIAASAACISIGLILIDQCKDEFYATVFGVGVYILVAGVCVGYYGHIVGSH